MMQERRIKLLQSIPFFGAITDRSIALMLSLSQTLKKKAGEIFFLEHEPGDSLFLLEKGRAKIYKTHNDKEYLIRVIEDGACFGDMALIDLISRGASVRAITDCTAIEIPYTAMSALYEQDREQYLIMQMNMAREMSRRLRDCHNLWFQSQIEQDRQQPKHS